MNQFYSSNSIDRLYANSAIFPTSQIVFIDAGVTDYQALANGVVSNTEVVILDSNRDGIEQISQVLSQKPYSTVHIVSHGSPGCLYLGNTQLSLDTLDDYKLNLKTWFSSSSLILNPLCEAVPFRASLLIYGCNVAAGDAGAEFISKLNAITNAKIAASTTSIGNAAKGGNWELDYQIQKNLIPPAFTQETQNSYAGVFAVTTSGKVFIDYNNDGTQQASNDAEEDGYEGITIIAYDGNDNIIAQTTSDASGNYTLSTPDNTPLRIEFGNLPDGFVGSSIAGADSVSDILFLDGTSNITANFGIHRPSDITTGSIADIDLITVCYVAGIGNNGDSGVVVHNYTDAGSPTSTPNGSTPAYQAYDSIANFQDVGTVYGLAHHRESNTVFTGSFYKRHTALLGTIDFNLDGDASSFSNDATGAAYTTIIYTISNDGSDTVTEFARLDDIVDPRGAVDNSTYDWDTDTAAFAAVGKTGLGDVELSEDSQTLWAVNLNDNKLYELPVGNSSAPLTPAAPGAGEIDSHDFVTQIINNGDDLGVNPQQNIRPFALSTRDGLVYVGMVNTAQYDAAGVEGNLTAADLRAFVYTFDPNNPTAAPTQVLDIPLNYERDHIITNGSTVVSGNWNPWTDTFPTGLVQPFNGEVGFPQPILSDIDFDPDGNMILGFRDRWGDQLGYAVNSPDGTQTNLSSDAGGDMLQAIYDDVTDTWTIETHVTTDGINGNNDPDGEFFRNEFLEENNNTNDSTSVHAETAQGGLTIVPGVSEVVTTAMDPVDIFSGGLEWFSTVDGSFVLEHQVTENQQISGNSTTHGLEIFASNYDGTNGQPIDSDTLFGKANGLGDLEFIAAAATLEIGDRIWFDTDQDGIQDVGEGNVPDGVNVELYASGGTTALQTTTTTNGNYFFAGLSPLTDYEVRLVASDLNGGLIDGYQATLQNSGSNDKLDSDAADSGGIPTIFLTTGASATNDQSFDIGLTNTPTYDYGDAPDAAASTGTGNYQTTDSDGGAKHILGSGLTIGSGVTADDGTLQNVGATADTDDGVTFTEVLETSDSSFSVSVDVNLPSGITSANLAGWIDFNQDGAFNANEAVRTTVNSSGATVLTWNSFPDIIDGTTYARFRLSTASALDTIDDIDSIGEFSDGEVEDYQITIGRDYGDAVDTGNSPSTGTGNYQTISTDSGASHGIINGLSIGSIVDADSGTLQDANASQDDTDGDDDEDGVTFSTTLSASDTSYSVAVDVTNTTGSDAVLTGWIDFDQSGTFDSDERVSTVFSNSGTQNLTWDSLPGLVEGTTYARFRLSNNFTTTPTVVNTILYSQTFDGSPTGWTVNPDGTDTATTDASGQWVIADPVGHDRFGTTDFEQLEANSSPNALVTGSGDTNTDVDNTSGAAPTVTADGVTTVDSPDFSLPSGVDSIDLSLEYYLSVNAVTTNYDNFTIELRRSSDNTVLSTLLNETPTTEQTGSWTTLNSSLNSHAGETAYLRFIATDIGNDSIIEVGIDDISITSSSTEQTPVALDSTGALETGEVEDYVVNVSQRDYGDAPDATNSEATGDYQTTDDNGGASHIIDSNLKIGSLTDADSGTLQNVDATADDTDDTDDEDGVVFNSGLDVNTTSYSTTVTVTNNTGSPATLVGWVDFNQNGQFESGEAVVANIPTGNTDTDVTLTWDNNDANNSSTTDLSGNGDLPGTGALSAETLATGTTYARFRLTTDSNFDGDNPLGAANDGEVEDYKLTVNLDYGDARDTGFGTATSNYQTTAEDGGASHIIDPGLSIGNSVDADDGTLQDASATADNNDGTDDEDGISSFTTLQTDDDSYSVTVSVTNTKGAATLIGWIDFDQSGTFDADEAVSQAIALNDTSATLNWSSLPTDITDGITYARFRLSTDFNSITIDDSTSIGAASDGEVEDYLIDIEGIDYGDAPDVVIGETGTNPGEYSTTQDDSGASHIIVGGLKLGATVDAENGTLQNTAADADDLANNNDDDDEDGITFNSTLNSSSPPVSFTVDVDYTNDTASDAVIVGWIDFDQSGTFDSDEAVATTVSASTLDLSTTLTWNSFPGLVTGTTYSRFRISNDFASSTILAENFDSSPTGWTVNPNGTDTATTDATGQWVIADPVGHNRFNAGGAFDQLEANSSPNALVTGSGDTNTDVDNVNGTAAEGVTAAGITTINSPTFTLPSSGFDSIDLSLEYFLSTNDTDDNFTIELRRSSDNALLSTLLNETPAAQQTGSWTTFTSSLDSNAGETAYLRFIATDNNNDSVLEVGVDDVNISSVSYSATGALDSGEVEDYQITVEGGDDYGDASNTGTSYDIANTSHSIVSGLNLGSIVDDETSGEATTNANPTATGDNNDGQDDEDGVTFDSVLTSSNNTYSVTVDVVNTTGSDAELIGWIDFDGDGIFQTDEASEVLTISTSGQVTLNWTGILDGATDTVVGDTYARFRLNDTPANLDTNTPTGQLNGGVGDGGEVEDYLITVVEVDYGDAPDLGSNTGVGNYQTTDADNGASHIINSALTIGSEIDADDGTLQDTGATEDDSSNTGSTNDEDGVSDFAPLGTNTDSYSVTVAVNNTTGSDATLIGWVDFDRNGSFEESEAVSVTVPDNETSVTLNWTSIPNDINAGTTYARFRLSSDFNGITIVDETSIGSVSDGEVEDYQVEIKNGISGTNSAENTTGTSGDDLFIANKGEDTLTGGAGNDCYHFNETSDGIDTITDFTVGEDKIDLSAILADEVTAYTSGDPFAQGYVELAEIILGGNTSTIVQIDFDAGDETLSSDLYHKDIALLEGVALSTLDTSRDFII